jgi:hypothetical protein
LCLRFDDGEPDIPMTLIPYKHWKYRIRDRIRKTIVVALNARTVHGSSVKEDGPRTRKDYYGIGSRVDHPATTSLLSGRLKNLPKCLDTHTLPDDPQKYSREPKWQQRTSAIIAGSLRAFDRLEAAGLCKGRHCHLCECEKGDTAHILWDCPIFEAAPRPFSSFSRTFAEAGQGHVVRPPAST